MSGYAIGLGSSNIAYRAVGRRDTAPNRITIVNRRGFRGETLRTLRPCSVLCTVLFSRVRDAHPEGHVHAAPAVAWSRCRCWITMPFGVLFRAITLAASWFAIVLAKVDDFARDVPCHGAQTQIPRRGLLLFGRLTGLSEGFV